MAMLRDFDDYLPLNFAHTVVETNCLHWHVTFLHNGQCRNGSRSKIPANELIVPSGLELSSKIKERNSQPTELNQLIFSCDKTDTVQKWAPWDPFYLHINSFQLNSKLGWHMQWINRRVDVAASPRRRRHHDNLYLKHIHLIHLCNSRCNKCCRNEFLFKNLKGNFLIWTPSKSSMPFTQIIPRRSNHCKPFT